jgi:hypothetical protein
MREKTRATAREIMTTATECVGEDKSVQVAAEKMTRLGVESRARRSPSAPTTTRKRFSGP